MLSTPQSWNQLNWRERRGKILPYLLKTLKHSHTGIHPHIYTYKNRPKDAKHEKNKRKQHQRERSTFILYVKFLSLLTSATIHLFSSSCASINSARKKSPKNIKMLINFDCFPSMISFFNPFSANPTKWPNTLKQFVGCCQRIA